MPNSFSRKRSSSASAYAGTPNSWPIVRRSVARAGMADADSGQRDAPIAFSVFIAAWMPLSRCVHHALNLH
ncbi:hypothetical protein KAF26_02675 [Xanthomonas translucens pv. secalis]|uniref:hypothetical protein n=1 Tax=Xanthomonas campestris pv. translucens TaxID=343 RepID=UPI000A54773B|nr:hypothetical protein [Xanthomonas translucens]MCT8283679.1 hypothetical protein [Xanthomonas translucens pv. undulosa]UKE43941.1 hypothetical protein KAF26_02675 [Xanthomonas translucens pv. secalis]